MSRSKLLMPLGVLLLSYSGGRRLPRIRSGLVAGAVFGSLLGLPGSAAAQVILDRYMTIQPIQVCDNAGANCAPVTMFANEFAKIYEQASVATAFLPTAQLNSTPALNPTGVGGIDVAGNGQHPNANTVNVWFVNSLPAAPGNVLFGEAWVGANGAVINGPAVQTFNSGVGRLDTAAHEVGHNLSLRHDTLGAGGANNLMSAGTVRNVPGTINDIFPDGADLDQLTANQITAIRNSPLTNPVPEVLIDTNGSTPFDTNDFFLVDFNDGPAGVSLASLTVDLSPVNAFFDTVSAGPVFQFPGGDGSPFQTSNLAGLAAGDVVAAVADGGTSMTIDFTSGAFTPGDSFRFGVDVDLFSAIDQFGATPEELVGTLFSFRFSDGFGSTAQIEDDLLAFSTRPTAILPFNGQPSFNVDVPPGRVIDTPDPQAVPEPSSLLLVAACMLALARARGRRESCGA